MAPQEEKQTTSLKVALIDVDGALWLCHGGSPIPEFFLNYKLVQFIKEQRFDKVCLFTSRSIEEISVCLPLRVERMRGKCLVREYLWDINITLTHAKEALEREGVKVDLVSTKFDGRFYKNAEGKKIIIAPGLFYEEIMYPFEKEIMDLDFEDEEEKGILAKLNKRFSLEQKKTYIIVKENNLFPKEDRQSTKDQQFKQLHAYISQECFEGHLDYWVFDDKLEILTSIIELIPDGRSKPFSISTFLVESYRNRQGRITATEIQPRNLSLTAIADMCEIYIYSEQRSSFFSASSRQIEYSGQELDFLRSMEKTEVQNQNTSRERIMKRIYYVAYLLEKINRSKKIEDFPEYSRFGEFLKEQLDSYRKQIGIEEKSPLMNLIFKEAQQQVSSENFSHIVKAEALSGIHLRGR